MSQLGTNDSNPFPDSPDGKSYRGYHSDGETGGKRGSFRNRASMSLVTANFEEMQESERYGIFHPRYRVPQPVFGLSTPFIHKDKPKL
eukprot:gene5438-6939_t